MNRYLWFVFFVLLALPHWVSAQTDVGLKAYYSFDNCDATDETSGGSDGTIFSKVAGWNCQCGVSGNALEFDGDSTYVVFFGLVNTYFTDDDFTLSFYYKPTGNGFQTSLVSKREACDQYDYLDVRTQSSQTRIAAELNEDDDNKVKSVVQKNSLSCWQHVTVTRINKTVRHYINGQLEDQQSTTNLVDIQNNAVFAISNSPCIGQDGTSRFKGLFDELRVYNRGLIPDEVEELYLGPDQIGNRDTIIFLGNSVEAFVTNTCASEFEWSPTDGVSDPLISNPIITPDSSMVYSIQFTDSLGCVSMDTLNIRVIDPATLDCDQIFLPSAFTPNEDGINDVYYISNPQVIPEFISFEIFDRWGSRVFYSEDGLLGWDGTVNGKKIDPAVFVYQLRYNCREENITKTGTITLVK